MRHTRLPFILWRVFLLSLLFPLSSTAQYIYQSQIGAETLGVPQFSAPVGVAVDEQGNVYVADNGNHQVRKFNTAGQLLLTFGSYGSEDGQYNGPSGLTLDGEGNLYVADRNNHRILKFNTSGEYVRKFGSDGSGEGQLSSPGSVAVDAKGNVYVADNGNYRILKFDADGNFDIQFGGLSSEDGQLLYPSALAVDAQGNMYVADRFNHRIEKFDANGQVVLEFGSYGSEKGQFINPMGLVLDGQGNLYVADESNSPIQKFTLTGKFVSTFGSLGSADGQLKSPSGIAADAKGNVYVADYLNRCVQQFNAEGKFVSKLGGNGSRDGQFVNPAGVAVDGEGNVYVADQLNHRIQKFDRNGEFVTKFGSFGNGAGQFAYPTGLVLDGSGNLFVADTYNHRVQKFDSKGQLLLKFGSEGKGSGQFNGPIGVALDRQGNVYVTDQYNHRVQKFDSDGGFMAKFGSEGWEGGQFNSPSGVAVDDQGNIYVADMGGNRIQKFSGDRQFLLAFGSQGTAESEFQGPAGIAVDAQGNLFVTDQYNHRVQKFDASGLFLLGFGSKGGAKGQFNGPWGIALDGQGGLYVSDVENHRVQQFVEDGNPELLVKVDDNVLENNASLNYGTTDSGKPSSIVVTIYNTSEAGSLVVSNLTLPDGFAVSGKFSGSVAAGSSATFTLKLTAAHTGDYSGTATFATNDTDENPFSVKVSGKVIRSPQQITFEPLESSTYGDNPFELTAATTSNQPVSYTSSNPAVATVTGNTVTITGVGVTEITATQAGDDNYYPAKAVTQSLTVYKAAQTISFPVLADKTSGDAPFALEGVASSGLPVTYSSSNTAIAVVSGGTLSITGVGTCTITAFQAGNVNYGAADPVAVTFTVHAGTVVPEEGNTWTGTDTWTSADNWTSGSIPSSNSDATIASGIATVSGTAGVRNLTLNEGTAIHVPAGQVLLVTGDITNLGGSITGTGTVRFAKPGTQSLKGPLALSGIVEVRDGSTLRTNDGLRLETGSVLLHGVGTTGGGGNVTGLVTAPRNSQEKDAYHGWSSPVSAVNTAALGGTVYTYDETKPYANYARWIRATGTMQAGTGYFAYGAVTPAFTGAVNNGLISVPLTYTAAHQPGERGFNLVGNPYPGPLDYDAFIAANPSINGAVYFWDDDHSGGSGYANADYIVKTRAGIVAGPNSGAVAGDRIASHQGFFVEAKEAGTVTFTNAMRTGSANTAFFRKKSDEIGRVKLGLSGNGKYNETLVAFATDATEEVDRLYDAVKLKGNSDLSFFSRLQGEDYAIQALPLLTHNCTVPLGVQAAASGSYTLKVTTLERIDAAYAVLLEDKATGQFHDLRQQPVVTVQLEAGRYADRFVLHFNASSPTVTPAPTQPAEAIAVTPTSVLAAPAPAQAAIVVTDSPTAAPVRIFTAGHTIHLHFVDEAVTQASGALFTLGGQRVEAFSTMLVVNGRVQLISEAPQHQVYIFQLTTDKGTVAKRVYLGN